MSFRSPTPLPDEVVDRLFSALVVRYGTPFTDRWRDLDLDAVKGDWARELGPFNDNRNALRYALDHLPEKPPTVIDFRKLCNEAPVAQAMLPSSAPVRGPTPQEREQLRALAADIRAGKLFAKPGRAWAADLIRCHEAGWRNGKAFRSTPAALEMARSVVNGSVDGAEEGA
jgi:hypothetical protein